MVSAYRYISKTIQSRSTNPIVKGLFKQRVLEWKNEDAVTRIDHPTNLGSAKAKGYKAKQGIIMVRVRVRKGTYRKPKIKAGRRPKRKGITRMTVNVSLRTIAEQRADKKFPNMEVLNSYFIAKTGRHEYFEVIMYEPHNSSIKNCKEFVGLCEQSGRVWRGLTCSKKKTNE